MPITVRFSALCLALVLVSGCRKADNAATSLSAEGVALKNEGNYPAAVEKFSAALKSTPNDVSLLNSRGMTYALLSDYNNAVGDFDKTLTLEPKHALAIKNRARVHYYLGHFEQSLADFRQGAELDPKNLYVPIWAFIAAVRLHQNAMDDLKAGLTRADSVWPAPIARYLEGTMSEAVLDSIARTTDTGGPQPNQCHAFYIAEMALSKGDSVTARNQYDRVLKTCVNWATEFHATTAQLARMK